MIAQFTVTAPADKTGIDGTKSALEAGVTLARTPDLAELTFAIVAAALVMASPAAAQTMYRCHDLGKTIYSDKPCLNADEIKQIAPNGNPTEETTGAIAQQGARRRAAGRRGSASRQACRGGRKAPEVRQGRATAGLRT